MFISIEKKDDTISNSQINSQYFPKIQKHNQDTSPYSFFKFFRGIKLKFFFEKFFQGISCSKDYIFEMQ